MRDETFWIVSHLRDRKFTVHSTRTPEELTMSISTRVSAKPKLREEFASDFSVRLSANNRDTFAEFNDDFSERGTRAIANWALWGKIEDNSFDIEVASGYGAQRWWIPNLKGRVTAAGDGSVIDYRLRGIQRRQVFIACVAFAMGIATVAVGMDLLFSPSTRIGGGVALAGGLILLGLLSGFMRTAVRVAMAMELFLRESVDELANSRER